MYLQSLDENLVFSKCYKKVKQRAAENKIDLLAAYHELEKEEFNFEAVIAGHDNPFTVNVSDVLAIAKHETCSITVIPPFITGLKSRYQATMANFCLGVMPPSPILGRSLL